MPVDIFLKLENIDGESLDFQHTQEIDVTGWGWGMTQSGTTHMGAGAGGGKVSVQDLTVSKWVDKATPALHKHCCDGSHIATATFTIRKAGGDAPVEYVVIELEQLIVTSIMQGGSGEGDRLTETVTFNFAKYRYKYIQQMEDGSAGPESEQGWNIPVNETW